MLVCRLTPTGARWNTGQVEATTLNKSEISTASRILYELENINCEYNLDEKLMHSALKKI